MSRLSTMYDHMTEPGNLRKGTYKPIECVQQAELLGDSPVRCEISVKMYNDSCGGRCPADTLEIFKPILEELCLALTLSSSPSKEKETV